MRASRFESAQIAGDDDGDDDEEGGEEDLEDEDEDDALDGEDGEVPASGAADEDDGAATPPQRSPAKPGGRAIWDLVLFVWRAHDGNRARGRIPPEQLRDNGRSRCSTGFGSSTG